MTTTTSRSIDGTAALAGRRLAAAARTAAISVSTTTGVEADSDPLAVYQRSPKRRADWVRYLAAKAKHHQ